MEKIKVRTTVTVSTDGKYCGTCAFLDGYGTLMSPTTDKCRLFNVKLRHTDERDKTWGDYIRCRECLSNKKVSGD